MKRYDITKYKANQSGKDEWLGISDIGKIYDGIKLTSQEYKRVEDAYVNAILEIIKYLNITNVKIKNVYKCNIGKELKGRSSLRRKFYSKSILQTYQSVDEHSVIGQEDLCNLIRLELREDIGGLLYVPYRLKIFIGYDFMMGVHCSKALEPIFEKIEESGLNIFQF